MLDSLYTHDCAATSSSNAIYIFIHDTTVAGRIAGGVMSQHTGERWNPDRLWLQLQPISHCQQNQVSNVIGIAAAYVEGELVKVSESTNENIKHISMSFVTSELLMNATNINNGRWY